MVRPGATGGLETDNSIGIFGVGSKRSVVALAKHIRITTCPRQSPAYRIEYGDDWLASPSWDVPCFELPPESEGHTSVVLTKPRQPITQSKIDNLIHHLRETYGRFLQSDTINITVNKRKITAIQFEEWSYHPDYPPTEVHGAIDTPDGDVQFSIIGGLLTESAYSTGEFGVYFYCNNRLIERGTRNQEVGFRKGEAGVPHHSHSASRVIVSLSGPAKWMPWNSSKSGINYAHETFGKIQGVICDITATYASLSKRLQPQWTDEIFPCKVGNVAKYELDDSRKITQVPFPQLPAVRPNYAGEITANNKKVVSEGTWREKYVDSMVAIHALQRLKVNFRNQMGVILCDGILDLALLDFIIHEQNAKSEVIATVTSKREYLLTEVQSRIDISSEVWATLASLKKSRQGLFNDPSAIVPDAEMEEYRTAVQLLLWKLFKIKFPNRTSQTYS